MGSNSRKVLAENLADIDRLLELHEMVGGDGPGRRHNLEVLNKSAIVLITAFWEAYCEDLASEALRAILDRAKAADDLPEELRKAIAKELKAKPHELAIWQVADNNWKKVVDDRFEDMREQRNRKLNTPKHGQIDELFKSTLGLSDVSSKWNLSAKTPAAKARANLEKFVELRGAVAHRGNATQSVTKKQVTDYRDFIEKIAGKTGGAVNTFIKQQTGKRLWKGKPSKHQ